VAQDVLCVGHLVTWDLLCPGCSVLGRLVLGPVCGGTFCSGSLHDGTFCTRTKKIFCVDCQFRNEFAVFYGEYNR
jgi:hypothetical protein